MNTDLKKKARHDFEKDFFKLIKNVAFGKTMETVRKQTVIKNFHNKKKNKLFCVRTKLSCYKVFYRKFLGFRNERKFKCT